MKLAPFNAYAWIALAVLALVALIASRFVSKKVSGLPESKIRIPVSILALATLLAGFFGALMFAQTTSLIEVGPGQTQILMMEPGRWEDFHMVAPGEVKFGLSRPVMPGDRIQINRADTPIGSVIVSPDGRWTPFRINEPGPYSFVLVSSGVREIMLIAY